MYQDNSLTAASRLKNQLIEGHKKREMRREAEIAKIQSLLNRRELAAFYFEKFGVKVEDSDIERLSENMLLIKLETQHHFLREQRASILI